jgi:hypothetical protein
MDTLPAELVDTITCYITSGSTWKAWQLTCRKCWASTEAHFAEESALTDQLLTAIKMYPNYVWKHTYEFVSQKVTWDFIVATRALGVKWSHYALAANPTVTWEIVVANPTLPWEYHYLSRNPNITWEIVVANSDKPWDYKWLARNNSTITWDIIVAHPILPDGSAWDYNCLSVNPNISWEIIMAHPDKPWDYEWLATTDKITWEIVMAHPILPNGDFWDYGFLSSNPNITWDIVSTHPILPNGQSWCYSELTINPNMTWEIIAANPTFPWDYSEITGTLNLFSKCSNLAMAMDIITASSIWPEDKRIIYYMLSKTLNPQHESLWDVIVAHPILPGGGTWLWGALSRNPNLSPIWEIVSTNPRKSRHNDWDYHYLAHSGKIPWRWLTVYIS